MKNTTIIGFLLGGVCFAVLSGCGSSQDGDQPETAPVTGSVTYKGESVTEGTVIFHPQGPGNPATGQLGPNGRFTLTTSEKDDGAVIGHHVVTVQVFPKGALPGMETQTSDAMTIPQKYQTPDTSDLVVEVKEGSNNLKLELED